MPRPSLPPATVHCCEDREFQETVAFTKNTDSTSSTVGAVALEGGLGVKLKLNVGGRTRIDDTTQSTTTTT